MSLSTPHHIDFGGHNKEEEEEEGERRLRYLYSFHDTLVMLANLSALPATCAGGCDFFIGRGRGRGRATGVRGTGDSPSKYSASESMVLAALAGVACVSQLLLVYAMPLLLPSTPGLFYASSIAFFAPFSASANALFSCFSASVAAFFAPAVFCFSLAFSRFSSSAISL
ncbi:uncharacterized protein LACBIDRAFT_322693 [Laccaria bicolor S238N-H82]|uniref:Predicted protein n=1 Tax=Laccaria bicolor (strain S238N-H82 / ATCC MYA-4686) TaxID=486041 RepID=B0CX70_LACBS|nr:uncharacterized protein LACBIDRAFT_322693 [Laccaria bicolor S238N-H82]EDR13622.1 predicted protein [Laccaria bicolor S238N-H82]|eukprot:XP_001876120.1 predicted protein [Laccaria bicolor S238N-H82]